MFLEVLVLNPTEVIFEGRAQSVKLPGEEGAFEVLPFHKRIMSRLVSGRLLVDEKEIPLERGVVMVDQNRVTIIIEDKV